MISKKMENMVANSSAIRAMFEEGNRLAKIYGPENAVSYTHLNRTWCQSLFQQTVSEDCQIF